MRLAISILNPQNNERDVNRNCFFKIKLWQMSVLGKGLENSLTEPAEWWLSLLSKAFELTAFEHRRYRPSPHTSLTISSLPFVSEAFPSFRSRTAINHFSFAQDSSIIRIPVPPFSSSVFIFRLFESFLLPRKIKPSIPSVCIV